MVHLRIRHLLCTAALMLALGACERTPPPPPTVAAPAPVDLREPLVGVDTTRPLITPTDDALQDSLVRIPYAENGLWGFADTTGQIVIRPKYLRVLPFGDENLTLVRGDQGWGLVDKQGREAILPTLAKGIGRVGNGVYAITLERQTALVNKAGKRIDHGEVLEVYLTDGDAYMAVRTVEGYGFMDVRGQMVIPPRFIQVSPMVHGVACVTRAPIGGWQAMGRNGKPVSELVFDELFPFTHGFGVGSLAHDSLGNQWGVIDTAGRVVIPFVHGHIPGTFQDQYIACPTDNPDRDTTGKLPWVIYDRRGRQVARTNLQIQDNFQEGLAVFQANGKYGFLDTLGQVAIRPTYEFASSFSQGLACVTQGGNDGFIDRKGRVVIPFKYKRLSDFLYMTADGAVVAGANSGETFYLDRRGREYRNFSR